MSLPIFDVLSPGALSLYQDRGRWGYAQLGVSSSGSFDRFCAARANAALGNTVDAPVIEVLMGGLSVRFHAAAHIIFYGTDSLISITSAAGKKSHSYTGAIIDVQAGDVITLDHADSRLRTYFAIRGGFAVTPILESASSDRLSGIGPAPLSVGDTAHCAYDTGEFLAMRNWYPTLRQLPPLWQHKQHEILTVTLGPRDDWFSSTTVRSFLQQRYRVTSESDRIGIRLQAPQPIERLKTEELQSEGMVRGCIQIPPSGDPVIFGADHPVTGGYPVIAVLTRESCDRCAQLVPGQTVSFTL
ncbi:biotin-dependent carboxyltransferase family protein [Corynebacterium sp. sy017]|uniref:5-oxoprolinase subunit C family protein n=1 Tax=unclassified Corynebacterium TaxID=2624378 RepID=UPI0011846E85|nr:MULTISPECIES: biotin-dependent carboxyltransferase family protein [unclassified Corynebacterium]MBP3088915.1 biotin-dependent carboxyltransferase family protein [Corynebacterium sp. sy017]TSD91246.1 biotin-dependent carboxyltransferase family protein [Corynebacterium sp. SY003]